MQGVPKRYNENTTFTEGLDLSIILILLIFTQALYFR